MLFKPGSEATFTLIVICGMCIVEISLISRYVLIQLAGAA